MYTFKDPAYDEAAQIGMGKAILNILIGIVSYIIGAAILYAIQSAIMPSMTTLGWSEQGLLWGAYLVLGIPLAFLGVLIIWGASRIVGGSGGYTEHFNAASHLSLINILYIIPFIGQLATFVLGLWGIAVVVVTIMRVHKLGTGAAIGALAIAIGFWLVVAIIVVAIAAVIGFSTFSAMGGMA